MTTQQPEALRLAEILEGGYSLAWLYEHGGYEVSAELRRQHARITALEAQLEAVGAGGVGPLIASAGFDAADMATASAQGFRDGVASLSANAVEPRNALDRDALIDAIAQGLHGTWHCTRVWEAWHVGTMSQDDFEPIDESETPTEIADAVLALLAATPTAQQGVTYAEMPTSSHAGRVYEEGFLIGTCPLYTADKMRAFADATNALRASRGQAPAKPDPAYSAACNLATALFKKHFAHLPDFASGQAVWSLCDSTAGVISQIDNMVSGLVQPPTTSPQADSVLEDAARYQWIRGPGEESTRYSRWLIEYWDGPNGWQPMQRERMDSAIDAARKQGANHD